MELTIRVLLPQPRTKLGSLVLTDADTLVFGPVEAYGKADNKQAARHGNPSRDPARPYGDTPLGVYNGFLAHLPPAPGNIRRYGPHGYIALDPVSGQALIAKQNGRHGLLIHGGPLSAAGTLRPTFGCVRLSNPSMKGLLQALRAHRPAGPLKLLCRIDSPLGV